MNSKYSYGDKCPVLHTLNAISGKWKVLILHHLLSGSLRYNQLKRRLPGISNIMLTRSLHHLEKYGLVERIQYLEKVPHVEYFLTQQAKKLVPAIAAIAKWGKEQMLLTQLLQHKFGR
ncbi:MAG: transcriptional regulator, HxlR family [Firmicutes bacterium]|nr:transcriptional regulator, HxlR family [Bacillota bacterium]